MTKIDKKINSFAFLLDEKILDLTPKYFKDKSIFKVVDYVIKSGGKRIRPLIMLETALMLKDFRLDAVKNSNDYLLDSLYLELFMAIEFIHCYSLIHDDLPAMDNDDYRRGVLTVHKKYGQATAILVGDGLLTLAFEMISEKKYKLCANKKVEIINVLSNCSGFRGMISGQIKDMNLQNTRKDNIKGIKLMQSLKSGKLIEASILIPAIVEDASNNEKEILRLFSEKLGLCFQITDDLFDLNGDEKKIGKKLRKDKDSGKVTLIDLLGEENAKNHLIELKEEILDLLNYFGETSKNLKALSNYVVNRKS